jgi:hypothetical protein
MNLKASLVASFMLASFMLTSTMVEPVKAQNPDIPQGAGAGAGDQSGSQGKRMRKMDPQRRAKMRERMMKRFDTNGDGSLDETEKTQMQAARKNRKGHGRKHRGGRKHQNQNGAGANSGGMPVGGTAGSPPNQ